MNNELYRVLVLGDELSQWVAISEETGGYYFTPDIDEAYLFDSACTARNLIQQIKQDSSSYQYHITVK